MLNQQTSQFFDSCCRQSARQKTRRIKIAEAQILDAGVEINGSIEAGIALARICMSDLAEVSLVPECHPGMGVDQAVFVRTDDPLHACLGSQYAGWPVQTDDFFAMGSGPMRLLRGREPMLEALALSGPELSGPELSGPELSGPELGDQERSEPQADSGDKIAVGVLESDKFPTDSAIALIANDCGVPPKNLRLAIAPSTSIAGTIQVVARSIETALHKLHELNFDVRQIVSGTGIAPLPPVAKTGDTVSGIGRTNDAILYGGRVTLWVNCEDDAIEAVIDQVPSGASKDHGQPFAKTFKKYGYDFYQVDPMLFSPAVITVHNMHSGRTFRSGSVETDVLRQSFLS